MTKRLISLFLALIMVVGVLPCTVFAVEPEQKKENPLMGGDGFDLTIVNDSDAPAKYTVSRTRGEVLATATVILAPRATETVAKLQENDTYSVAVEYPEYYQVKNATCKFESGNTAPLTVSADKPWKQIFTTGKIGEEGYHVFTLPNENDTVASGTRLYHYGVNVTEEDIYHSPKSDSKAMHRNTWGTDTDVVWKTFGQWQISISTSEVINYQLKCGKSDGTVNKASNGHSFLALFFDGSKYYNGYEKISTNPAYKFSLLDGGEHTTIKNASGTDISIFADKTKYGTATTLDEFKALDYSYKEARVLRTAEILEQNIKDILTSQAKLDVETFTFDSAIELKVNASGIGITNKSTSSNKYYVYQLVEHKDDTTNVDTLSDITLTYTAEVPETVDASLDVLNHDLYAAMQKNLNIDWLEGVLDRLKANDITSAYLEDHPEKILEVVGLKTLADILTTTTMPEPAAITLTEVEEGNDFYQGKTYTLTAASDSNLIKPLYAKIELPDLVVNTMDKWTIQFILQYMYLKPKENDLATYRKKMGQLATKTSELLENNELNLASNSIWKSNVTNKTTKFKNDVNSGLDAAGKALEAFEKNILAKSASFSDLVKVLNNTELPIRVGYTFDFSGVCPGQYKVTFDGVASWSDLKEDLKEDRIITIGNDGKILEGLDTKRMAILDFIGDDEVWNKLYTQLVGKVDDNAPFVQNMLKDNMYDKDSAGNRTIAPALFTNTGVWLGTPGGPGSVPSGTNTIEFTAVKADGVTPLEGATYALVKRDQLMQLMQTMIGLGKVAVNEMGVPFDELMEIYQAMLQEGNIKGLTGDLKDKLGQFVPALLDTVMKLPDFSELNLPLILTATSNENGLVRFSAEEENTLKGVVKLGGLTMNTAKDVAGNVVSIINDDIIGTITTQLNAVKKRVGEINDSYKAALERVDAVKKSVNNTVSSIRNDINTMRNHVGSFLSNVVNRLKSFFGIVTVSHAAGFDAGTINTVSDLLNKLEADTEAVTRILGLLGKASMVMDAAEELSSVSELLNGIKDNENNWDKYVNRDGWRSSKPGEQKDPMNKLEEFMDQLEKKIKELNDTANSVKETAGKLDRPTEILNYLGKQGDGLYDVAYGLLDLLGVAIEGDDRFPDGNYILMQIAAPAGYTRSNVCYTLHVENGQTTAQRGILTPLLETNSKALEAYVASLSDVNKAKLEKFQKGADSYLDRQAKLWDAMNYFSMTRVIANGVRDSIIADVAEAVFKAMPGCFVDVDAVELEIRTALKQVDSNPTFDELLEIADKMITKSTATVGRGWTVIAAVNVVDQIPA